MRGIGLALALAIGLAGCGGSADTTPEVPEGWEVHESADLGYTMAHPEDWDAAPDAATSEDVFTGPDGEEIRVGAYRVEEGWAADIIFQDAESDAVARYGAPLAVVNELTVAEGARVLIFSARSSDDGGPILVQRAVVLLQPSDVWYVDWTSDVADEGGDRQRFAQFVRSFVPAPNLGDVEGG